MFERGTQCFMMLILMLAAVGCVPTQTAEQAAAGSTPVGDFELAAAGSEAEQGSKQAAGSTPLDTPEAAAMISTVTAEPEPTVAPRPPVETPEPVSDEDAAQIYAAAIREMYSVNHSFGGPGESPEFPLVYIVSTTDDGTLLGVPASPPQTLTPELQQGIGDRLADLLFETIWVGSFSEAPMDNHTGLIAEGQGIIITMGNIYAQEDGTVHLPFYMVCGTLCLSGKTYVLDMVDGAWQVTGSVGMEVQG